MSALHIGSAFLDHGWARDVRLEISGGRIAAIDEGVPPRPTDELVAIALPGMPNLHSHAFQRGMAGLAERQGPADDSFWTWREIMYRFVAAMTPDDIEAIAAFAYVEMLESGFTRVGEFHYLHHDVDGRPYADVAETAGRIGAAASQSGIGLTLLPVFYAHGGFGGVPTGSGQRRFVTDIAGYARLVDGCRAVAATMTDTVVGVAPHSLRAVTPDELQAIVPLAEGGPLHIHIAEQIREVTECVAWCGRRPVAWLMDQVAVDASWCLVHATHVTPRERNRLASTGAVAGLCPITEANLGDGVFPASSYRLGGGVWGIGSDSNVLIDMAEELRLLEYGQRLTERRRNRMAAGNGSSTGSLMFAEAVAGGGRALGSLAGLRTGLSADIVSLKADHPSLLSRAGDQFLDGLIFGGRKDLIDCVWRAGRKVVANGVHVRRDEITRGYRSAITRLLA